MGQKETATTNKYRVMIYGPKTDDTYVIEFRTAAGEALAISSEKASGAEESLLARCRRIRSAAASDRAEAGCTLQLSTRCRRVGLISDRLPVGARSQRQLSLALPPSRSLAELELAASSKTTSAPPSSRSVAPAVGLSLQELQTCRLRPAPDYCSVLADVGGFAAE
jgi:hypothetical protein